MPRSGHQSRGKSLPVKEEGGSLGAAPSPTARADFWGCSFTSRISGTRKAPYGPPSLGPYWERFPLRWAGMGAARGFGAPPAGGGGEAGREPAYGGWPHSFWRDGVHFALF